MVAETFAEVYSDDDNKIAIIQRILAEKCGASASRYVVKKFINNNGDLAQVNLRGVTDKDVIDEKLNLEIWRIQKEQRTKKYKNMILESQSNRTADISIKNICAGCNYIKHITKKLIDVPLDINENPKQEEIIKNLIALGCNRTDQDIKELSSKIGKDNILVTIAWGIYNYMTNDTMGLFTREQAEKIVEILKNSKTITDNVIKKLKQTL